MIKFNEQNHRENNKLYNHNIMMCYSSCMYIWLVSIGILSKS